MAFCYGHGFSTASLPLPDIEDSFPNPPVRSQQAAGEDLVQAPEEGSFWCTLCLIVARERPQVVPMAHLLCRGQHTRALGG